MRSTSTHCVKESVRGILTTASVCTALLLFVAPASAATMQTAGSLPAGKLSLGLELQADLIEGNPFSLGFHEVVGLAGGVDLYARECVGMNTPGGASRPVYIGAGLKWTMLQGRRDNPGIALLAGGHYVFNSYAGADGALLIDYTIARVTPFLGLDANLDFDDEVAFRMGLIGGVRVAVVSNVHWYVEGGLGLTGSREHYIATGPAISI